VEEQKYGYSPTMIVYIVLVIVTAVKVNSKELCPRVCTCFSDYVTCRNVFSDVPNMTQEIFHSSFRMLRVTGITRLDLEEDLFLRWNITSLTQLNLSQNYITKIWQKAFYSLVDLEVLDLSGNSITTVDSQTFYNNTGLVSLSLARNSITDIQQSTFQTNIQLNNLCMSGNKITSLHADLFKNSEKLKWVELADNMITESIRQHFEITAS